MLYVYFIYSYTTYYITRPYKSKVVILTDWLIVWVCKPKSNQEQTFLPFQLSTLFLYVSHQRSNFRQEEEKAQEKILMMQIQSIYITFFTVDYMHRMRFSFPPTLQMNTTLLFYKKSC